MSEKQSHEISSLEKMLLKDSQFFKQQGDDALQKQIMAAVERDLAENNVTSNTQTAALEPINMKKLSWWFSGLSVAAIAGFLSITLIPQLLMHTDTPKAVFISKFSVEQNMKKINEKIEIIETVSISKMTAEKEALKKDIQNIMDAFSVSKNNV